MKASWVPLVLLSILLFETESLIEPEIIASAGWPTSLWGPSMPASSVDIPGVCHQTQFLHGCGTSELRASFFLGEHFTDGAICFAPWFVLLYC